MGLSDEEKNMTGCIVTSLLSLDKVDRHTIKSCFSPQKRCMKMAADLRCVSPLGPRFRLSTDSPLPRRRPSSAATWGRPPNAQLNMLTGRCQSGENHVLKTTPSMLCPLCPASFFLRPGNKKYPESRKWLQLTIMLITIAQNKSQAEKSLDGNCYNCPNNGNEYFSVLNYMWLNI